MGEGGRDVERDKVREDEGGGFEKKTDIKENRNIVINM